MNTSFTPQEVLTMCALAHTLSALSVELLGRQRNYDRIISDFELRHPAFLERWDKVVAHENQKLAANAKQPPVSKLFQLIRKASIYRSDRIPLARQCAVAAALATAILCTCMAKAINQSPPTYSPQRSFTH